MTRIITPWALFDDCRVLMTHDDQILPLFQQAIGNASEFARLGALHRGDRTWLACTLVKIRDRWEMEKLRPELERKLAFCIASMIHTGAESVFFPAELQAAGGDPAEYSVYLDVEAFRKVFLDRDEALFLKFLGDIDDAQRERNLKDFVVALFFRSLQSIHTLVPDLTAMEEWIDKLLARVDALETTAERFARVFFRPDPETRRRWIEKQPFYCQEDPAISTVLTIRHTNSASSTEISTAFDETANRSLYGKALAAAIHNLRQTSRYWKVESEASMGHVLTVPEYIPGSWTTPVF